jgi:hypothetical protein
MLELNVAHLREKREFVNRVHHAWSEAQRFFLSSTHNLTFAAVNIMNPAAEPRAIVQALIFASQASDYALKLLERFQLPYARADWVALNAIIQDLQRGWRPHLYRLHMHALLQKAAAALHHIQNTLKGRILSDLTVLTRELSEAQLLLAKERRTLLLQILKYECRMLFRNKSSLSSTATGSKGCMMMRSRRKRRQMMLARRLLLNELWLPNLRLCAEPWLVCKPNSR